MSKLSHIDADGSARMVDVSAKAESERVAVAVGTVRMKPETLKLIEDGALKKGDVLTVAKIAGIMGAKRTSDLIPLCHPLPLSNVSVDLALKPEENAVSITASAKTVGKTGVEMEALTAVCVTGLTLYDMAKAIDRTMEIGEIRLVRKSGGASGDFESKDAPPADRQPAALKSKASAALLSTAHDRSEPNDAFMGTANRQAFQTFIRNNRIRITDLAKDAGIPSGEIFSFLNGQSPRLSGVSAQKLATAAGVSPSVLFGAPR